jgi:hypothetical protein
VWSTSENYPYGGGTQRASAVRFSPYNLTASDLGTSGYKQIEANRSNAAFTAYPTQAGAFFQWVHTTKQRYAYHPVNPVGAISSSDWESSAYADGRNSYWTTLGSTHETCPQNYSLTTGTSVNFRRPNDGSTTAVSSDVVAGSEMRQSLWEVPQDGGTTSIIGSVWGFYADGFFDRRSHTHAAYGSGTPVANTAVSIATKDVAYIGRLFYNRDNKRSLFFPASGYRYISDGNLNNSGGSGYYWSSSTAHTSTNAFLLSLSSIGANRSNTGRHYGGSVRCVRP